MGQFLQRVLQGFRKVMSAKSERPRIRGWEHGGSWWSSGPEGQRFIPLSMTRVHCNSIKYSGGKNPSDLSGCKGHTHWFQQNDVMFPVSGLLSLLCVREAASSALPLIAPKWKCPDNLMLPLSIFVVFIFNWSCKGFYSSDLSHFSTWHLLALTGILFTFSAHKFR